MRAAPLLGALALAALSSCSSCRDGARRDEPPPPPPLTRAARVDPSLDATPPVVIPDACYVKTRREDGSVRAACYTYHATGREPNYVDDSDLQTLYDFSAAARKNPYENLFVDRRAAIAEISDDAILAYARTSNYPPAVAPEGAYAPDAAFSFDDEGFDVRADGTPTGFRAYASFPVPGAFMPAGGSYGDTLVRLPAEFREREDGTYDRAVYVANLAVVEALVARRRPTGATRFVGRAGKLQREGALKVAPGLFPLGTELLHSVRYLDVGPGGVGMAARMKELRYARKEAWRSYAELELFARQQDLEKRGARDRAAVVHGSARGVLTPLGWRLSGFIEDARGALRPQTHRELAWCVGCHTSLGATVDGTFSFARKLGDASFRRGWFHPTQRGLAGVPDPRRADGRTEYALFLEASGAGEDDEVAARLLGADQRPSAAALARLRADVTTLLLPSPARALALDKAYRLIVEEQSFDKGRAPVIAPATNVWREVPDGEPTGLAAPVPSSPLAL